MTLQLIYLIFAKLLGWMVPHTRSDATKDIEILVLRHQLAVLRRRTPRSRMIWSDRALIAVLVRLLPVSRGAESRRLAQRHPRHPDPQRVRVRRTRHHRLPRPHDVLQTGRLWQRLYLTVTDAGVSLQRCARSRRASTASSPRHVPPTSASPWRHCCPTGQHPLDDLPDRALHRHRPAQPPPPRRPRPAPMTGTLLLLLGALSARRQLLVERCHPAPRRPACPARVAAAQPHHRRENAAGMTPRGHAAASLCARQPPRGETRTRLYRDGSLEVEGFPIAEISEYLRQEGVTSGSTCTTRTTLS